MNTWIKSQWFADLASTIREAIGEAQGLVEDNVCRMQTNAILRASGLHKQPETLSSKELVNELGKLMTHRRIYGQDLDLFDVLYTYLSPMRRIRDALLQPALYDHVRIPPTPPVIQDARIDPNVFWKAINEQVFINRVDG